MKRKPYLKIFALIILMIIPVFISGCWDSRELNKLSIVAGIGNDIDPATGKITLTLQSIVPSQVKSSSGSGGGGGEQKGAGALQTIQLDHATGSNSFDTLNKYSQHGTRTPFIQHTQIYVIGNDAAKRGVYPFISTIAIDPASRPNLLMVVSEEKASDILGIQDGMESIQALGMAAEIKMSANNSIYPAVTFLEFTNRLMSKTTAPIAPVIGIFEETGPEGKKIKKIHLTATAVFKGDKMIGRLNERESRGLLWAIGKIKNGYVIIPGASLPIVKAKSKIVAELNNDKIKITIKIDEESNLIEYTGHQDITPEVLQQLEKAQAQEIKSQVMAAVHKSYSLDADIFGFGDAIHRKYKKEWKDLKPRWDDIYPDIEVSVKVKAHLNEVGDSTKNIMKD